MKIILLFCLIYLIDADLISNSRYKKTKIDSDGLISIHTDNVNDVLVYENKVNVIKRTFKNGDLDSYSRSYHLDKSSERIIMSLSLEDDITKDGSVILFTKILKDTRTIRDTDDLQKQKCFVKTIKYWRIYNTEYTISNLCELLENVILIKYEKGKEKLIDNPDFRYGQHFEGSSKFVFFYRNNSVKYSLLNHKIEKFQSSMFNSLPLSFQYKKYISNYILEFIYHNKTVEYNYNSLELLQVTTLNLESPNDLIEIKNENNNYHGNSTNSLVITTATVSIMSIAIGLILLLIRYFIKVILEHLKNKNNITDPENSSSEKELTELKDSLIIDLKN